MVNEISHKYHLTYSAQDTGKNRRIQKYSCCYGGKVRGKTSKTGCLANFQYCRNHDGSFSAQSANLIHNHPVSEEFIDSHHCCCNSSQIEEINKMQTYGVLPGQIRTNLNVNVNKNIFYNMRRQTIMQSKNEDIDEFLTNLENNKWDIDVSNTRNDTLATITYLNKRVAESEYSTDLCYLDDTMCTNIY